MKKKDFLKELKSNLKKLEKKEIEEIISDYNEHFDIGTSEGRSEIEISKSLGNPKKLAKQLVANHYVKKAKEKKTIKNVLRAIFAVLTLSFFNLVFVLAPTLAIFGVLIALGVTAITLTLVGIIAPITVLLGIFQMGTTILGGTLVLISIATFGILLLIGVYYLTKLFAKLILKYLKFNLKFIGGNKNENN